VYFIGILFNFIVDDFFVFYHESLFVLYCMQMFLYKFLHDLDDF
jgi:putative flippase GtrA